MEPMGRVQSEYQIDKLTKQMDQLLKIMEAQQELVKKNAYTIKKQGLEIEQNRKDMENYVRNVRYELSDSGALTEKCFLPRIVDMDLTMRQLIFNHKSFVRFSQTELNILLGNEEEPENEIEDPLLPEEERLHQFRIKERLQKILLEENDKLCVALPSFFGNLEQFTDAVKKSYRAYLTPERRKGFEEILPHHKTYHDALIMHPNNYSEEMTGIRTLNRYARVRELWDGRNVASISVSEDYINEKNPYFENARSMKQIRLPKTNCTLEFDSILEECLKESEDTLFLLAAGPIGVILGAELCKKGFQAIDIGSIGLRCLKEIGG